jgi:hypothetical protein
MNRAFSVVAYAAAIAVGVVVFAIMPRSWHGGASAAAAAAQSTPPPSTVSVGGVTLRSVNMTFRTGIASLQARGPTSSTTTVSPAIPPAWFWRSLAYPAPSGRPRSRRCEIPTRGQSTRRTSRRLSTISQTSLTNRRPRLPGASVSRPPSTAVKTRAEGFEAAFVAADGSAL